MTRPDFSKMTCPTVGSADRTVATGREPWTTAERIAVKPLYTAADVRGLPDADTLPGFEPFLRGPQATMV